MQDKDVQHKPPLESDKQIQTCDCSMIFYLYSYCIHITFTYNMADSPLQMRVIKKIVIFVER